MGLLKRLLVAATGLTLAVGTAAADTTVKWLHIEVNPAQVKIWDEVARAYEAAHPGVKVEMQFLENEAYKAKLPTILQSKDRPHIIYSWAGGVLKAQIEAGVLEDITDQVKGYSDTITPAALAAFTQNGRVYGLPIALSQVGFLYNKELLAKANVDAAKIKTWDDLLAAVKALKAAGVTPIVVGGADKWPLHFYWTHLAVRIGGKAGVRRGAARREWRLRGRDLPEVRRTVQATRRPAAVPERLPRLQESAGRRLFRRRQGRDDARHQHRLSSAARARRRQGRSRRRQDRLVRLPCRARRQGRADRYARRHHRLARSPRARRRRRPTSSSSSSPRTCRRSWPPAIFSFPSSRAPRSASTTPS